MARELSCECGRCDTCEARERKRYSRMRARMTAEELAEEARRKAASPNPLAGLRELGDALGIERRPRRVHQPDDPVQIVVRVRHADRERVKATAKQGGWSMGSMMRDLVLRYVDTSDPE